MSGGDDEIGTRRDSGPVEFLGGYLDRLERFTKLSKRAELESVMYAASGGGGDPDRDAETVGLRNSLQEDLPHARRLASRAGQDLGAWHVRPDEDYAPAVLRAAIGEYRRATGQVQVIGANSDPQPAETRPETRARRFVDARVQHAKAFLSWALGVAGTGAATALFASIKKEVGVWGYGVGGTLVATFLILGVARFLVLRAIEPE